MRIRSAVMIGAVAAIAGGLAGCPSPCSLESPQVPANGIPASCTATPGQAVTYLVKLCPTCNQTSASCNVDMSAASSPSHAIFLDTKVEACTGSSSCPPSCQASPISCTFTPPAAGTYSVIVLDGATGTTQTSQLSVQVGVTPSC